MKQLVVRLSLAFVLTVVVAVPVLGFTGTALAAPKPSNPPCSAATNQAQIDKYCPKATATPKATSKASATSGDCKNGVKLSSPLIGNNDCVSNDQPGGVIFGYLRYVIQFLSGAVGLVIVLMIVIGGVQYATSIGDPAQVKAAKNRITNAITALILFALMYAILNFLIPGGIIG